MLFSSLISPEGITLVKDREAENKKPRFICWKMYFQNNLIGFASYRLYRIREELSCQFPPYWYLDEFRISKKYRQKGYGTYLLKHIICEMWSKLDYSIRIYLTNHKLPDRQLISWLIHRGFIEIVDYVESQSYCALHPNLHKVKLHMFYDDEIKIFVARCLSIPEIEIKADTSELLMQKVSQSFIHKILAFTPELLQINQSEPLNLANAISIESHGIHYISGQNIT